mmetsp:Transcript_19699/g.67057  ORF Transcript_19699/g.67057 Transcript_19699/m.67057 type:complete len:349 (-) Transcript_19699:866-1912(-)
MAPAEGGGEAPLLLLCFDVNKTIVMSDDAGGEDEAEMARKLAVQSASGRYGPPPEVPITAEQVLGALSLSAEHGAALAAVHGEWAGGQPRSHRFVVPALFALLESLCSRGRRVALQLRSFGTPRDIGRAAAEVDAYARNAHPLHEHGAGGDERLRVRQTGVWYRELSGEASVVFGTWRRPREEEGLGDVHAEGGMSYYDGVEGADVVSGNTAVAAELAAAAREGGTLALRDYYALWGEHPGPGPRSDHGKPFFVDPSDPDVHAIFFDDNMRDRDPYIVDSRHAKEPHARLPAEQVMGVHLLRVNPLSAALDPGYFIGLVDKAEEERARRMRADAAARRDARHVAAEVV